MHTALQIEPTVVRIPACSFLMGSDNGQDCERPVHRVWVDSFLLGATQVTNGEYRFFLRETSSTPPPFWNDSNFNHPQQPGAAAARRPVGQRSRGRRPGRCIPGRSRSRSMPRIRLAYTISATTFTNGAVIGMTRTTTRSRSNAIRKARSGVCRRRRGNLPAEVPGATTSKLPAARRALAFHRNSNTPTTVFE